jgi:PIN domain nuclease of toxin-antitoxin system
MMLLDTHIFLWWLFNDPKLPNGIKNHIGDKSNEIFVSAASVWEISTKFRLGKLNQAANIARNVPEWIERAGFEAMPMTPEHAQLAGGWTTSHRDPFDRMLAAQAFLEKMTLAS